MGTTSVIVQIDAELARLKEACAVLAGTAGKVKAPKKTAKRRLSAEARKRIAEAQKKRWALAKAKKLAQS